MKFPKVPHLEQYNGPFAMEEGAFNAVIDYVNRIDLAAHVEAMRARMDDGDDLDVMPDMTMTDDGIAEISVVGAMSKYGSSLSDGPSTIALRQCVRQAANDPKCTGIMMRFDSPGGTADGTDDLAQDVATAATKKPVFAHVDGMAASAAYYIASQCNQIFASAASTIGSIGTYCVMYDRSAQFAQNGVKAVVIRAGQMKGKGTPGTEITPDQISDSVRWINQINDLFVSAVAKGRKMSAEDAKALNDGRIHVGANAKALRLVDQIGGYEDAMADLRASIDSRGKILRQTNKPTPGMSSGAKSEEIAMDGKAPNGEQAAPNAPTHATPATPAAATLKDLKTKFPASTAEWREKAMEGGLTLAQASEQWMAHLASENARLADELEQAKVSSKPIGGKPVPTGKERTETQSGTPRESLMEKVEAKIKAGMSRPRAFAAACKENPELHQAWIAGHTEQHGENVRRGARPMPV